MFFPEWNILQFSKTCYRKNFAWQYPLSYRLISKGRMKFSSMSSTEYQMASSCINKSQGNVSSTAKHMAWTLEFTCSSDNVKPSPLKHSCCKKPVPLLRNYDLNSSSSKHLDVTPQFSKLKCRKLLFYKVKNFFFKSHRGYHQEVLELDQFLTESIFIKSREQHFFLQL